MYGHLTKVRVDLPFILIRLIVLCALVGGSFGIAAGQNADDITVTDRLRGIQLYNDGNTVAAIDVLNSVVKRDKGDADAWYYLGLALTRNNQITKGRKAFETAVGLTPKFGPAHTGLAYTLMLTGRDDNADREAARAIELNDKDAEAWYIQGVVALNRRRYEEAQSKAEAAIRLKPSFAAAYLLKSEVYVAIYANAAALSSKIISANPADSDGRKQRRERARLLIKEAADALEKFLSLEPKADDAETWRQQLKTLKVFAGEYGRVVSSAETHTRARVLSKPEPTYTMQARNAGITGTVILRAVFTADGTVEHILVLRSLPYGLTNTAIDAARRIKFAPAMIDGRPVSTFMQLEYNFNLF